MNKETRDRISKLIGQLDDIKSEVDSIRSDEQEKYENLPESFQSGDKGQVMESAISSLDEVEANIDDAISNLEQASA